MIETKSAGGVVLNRAGQVLVVSQHGTSWSLPKGHIDPGETALQAAIREVAEESGVTQLELIRELGTYQRHKINREGGDDLSTVKYITMFLFRTEQTELAPTDEHNPEARWVEPEKVADLLTHYKDQEFFTSVVGQIL